MKKFKALSLLALCLLIGVLLTGVLSGCNDQQDEQDDTKACEHVWGEWKMTAAPTCTQDGTESNKCTACGEPSTRTVKATGHTYIDSVVAPTKTEYGYTLHACACGDSYRDNTVSFTGSVGLAIEIDSTGKTCVVTGIGTCTDTELYIPSVIDGYSVTAIADEAFYEKYSEDHEITSVVLGNGITSIGAEAFACSTLVSVTLPDTLLTIGDDCFAEASITSIILPDGLKTIGEYAFECCYYLTSVVIPDSVTTIGEDAFSDCDALVSVTLSKNVTSLIGTFDNCPALTSITIPASVIEMDESTLRYCGALESIIVEAGNPAYHSAGNCLIETATGIVLAGSNTSVLPTDGSITAIADDAFSDRQITSLVIPEGVTSIGEGAFHGCCELVYLVIPASMETVGPGAFFLYGEKLETVYYSGTADRWITIDFTYYNDPLTDATLYLYAAEQPTNAGNYWHFVDGIPTEW